MCACTTAGRASGRSASSGTISAVRVAFAFDKAYPVSVGGAERY